MEEDVYTTGQAARLEAPQEVRESPESSGLTGGLGEIWEELGTERARREMAESTLRDGMAEERRRREEAERERDDLRRELYARREPRESPEPSKEQQGSRVEVSPTPVPPALRRPYGARGGGEYSEGRRSMHNDQAAQDTARLLVAFSTNHPEARTASTHGPDRPFSPSWADAEQAGLDRARRDTAMRWLVDENMLEREEEAEDLLGTGEGLHSEYGSVFRITDTGRKLLEEAWERRPE